MERIIGLKCFMALLLGILSCHGDNRGSDSDTDLMRESLSNCISDSLMLVGDDLYRLEFDDCKRILSIVLADNEGVKDSLAIIEVNGYSATILPSIDALLIYTSNRGMTHGRYGLILGSCQNQLSELFSWNASLKYRMDLNVGLRESSESIDSLYYVAHIQLVQNGLELIDTLRGTGLRPVEDSIFMALDPSCCCFRSNSVAKSLMFADQGVFDTVQYVQLSHVDTKAMDYYKVGRKWFWRISQDPDSMYSNVLMHDFSERPDM